MAEPRVGLSRDLIIHPGETLKEALEDRGLTQKTLAFKTGRTEQHVSRVVRGVTNISADFAKKLEYVLDIPASFWLNLQKNYDLELADYEDYHGISEKEYSIYSKMALVMGDILKLRDQEVETDKVFRVVQARKVLQVANLELISKMPRAAVYRMSPTTEVDESVAFAWHKLCDSYLDAAMNVPAYDGEVLNVNIHHIKALMFEEDINRAIEELQRIFGQAGVRFVVVPHYPGAPVHGMIRKNEDGSVDLCLTIRGSRADVFWFSLFHEVAHILNGDFAKEGMPEAEARADQLAASLLIADNLYEEFLSANNFDRNAIRGLAKRAEVPDYIVIGRLQKDEIIPWNWYTKSIPRLKWSK